MGDELIKKKVIDLFDLSDTKYIEDFLNGSTVLYVYCDEPQYSGELFILYRKNNKLYEVHDHHCSCNGFMNFDPEETTWESILSRDKTDKKYQIFHEIPKQDEFQHDGHIETFINYEDVEEELNKYGKRFN